MDRAVQILLGITATVLVVMLGVAYLAAFVLGAGPDGFRQILLALLVLGAVGTGFLAFFLGGSGPIGAPSGIRHTIGRDSPRRYAPETPSWLESAAFFGIISLSWLGFAFLVAFAWSVALLAVVVFVAGVVTILAFGFIQGRNRMTP